MITAQILTPWTGNGTDESPYISRLLVDYPSILKCVDDTNQPAENITPTPNLFVAQITCTPETLERIEADPLYKVIWSEAQ